MAEKDDDRNEDKSADQEESVGDKKRRRRKRKRNRKTEEVTSEEAAGGAAEEGDVESQKLDERTNQVNRTVFVEGIPYVAKSDDVRKFFQQHGLEDIEECRLPVWQDTGRLRGFGHVVFESIDSQKKALELNGKYLQNRYLSISSANKPRAPSASFVSDNQRSSEPSKKILLKNLSYQACEGDIETVLKTFGRIIDGGVRVVRHSVGERRSKGFAYVEFESIESAKKVYEKRIVIHGRPCIVDYDHGRIKGSFRTANGRYWQNEFKPEAAGAKKQKK